MAKRHSLLAQTLFTIADVLEYAAELHIDCVGGTDFVTAAAFDAFRELECRPFVFTHCQGLDRAGLDAQTTGHAFLGKARADPDVGFDSADQPAGDHAGKNR